MVPKIVVSLVLSSTFLLVAQYGEDDSVSTRVLFVTHSRSQVRTVLKQAKFEETSEACVRVLLDLESSSIPEESPEGSMVLGGAAPRTMGGLIAFMSAYVQTGSPLTTPRMNILPRQCAALISRDPSVQDGMIAYVDMTEAYHFCVFYSKREGLRVLRGIGGSATERKQIEDVLDRCGLPARGGSTVHFTGEIAEFFCRASELRYLVNATAS